MNPTLASHAPGTPFNARADDGALLFVDFKWLMSGLGWCVDLKRWQQDGEYVSRCLTRASAAPCEPLRAAAQRLQSCRSTTANF